MRHSSLFLVALGVVGLAAVGACSSGGTTVTGTPTNPNPVAPPAPPAPDPPPLTCGVTTATAKPNPGAKFCDLPGGDAPEITVPAGFCVREFTTTPVAETRVMRFSPNGDLFIATPSQGTPGGSSGGKGAIVVLTDDNHDGVADAVTTYAGGNGTLVGRCAISEADPADLSCVHGLTFVDGYLYYTRSDEVRRFPYKRGDRTPPAASGELVATLGGEPLGARWTHTLDVDAKGHILVSRGRFEGSSCSETEMTIGTVFVLDVTKPLPVAPTVLSDGFRNPMYLRCRSACGDCYANELSGDGWQDIGGHEKLVSLDADSHWGYPCCVKQGSPAPGGSATICAGLGAERVSVPLHNTPFGLDFETGRFPAPYTYGAFSALHGQVGSWEGTSLSWAAVDPKTHLPTGEFQVFASGWGLSGTIRGRATDAVFAPDGRLFVGDDISGRIFWIAPKDLGALQ